MQRPLDAEIPAAYVVHATASHSAFLICLIAVENEQYKEAA